ncbi:dephospho-CoA kinase [Odoribacter lunatus]|uniref:dephospho-CoA kinase n=1 Tax=Odoribacter lunatus TaxID=2941335 RepID=UPI00203BF29A|nr:dephospho-CoA kinase [Odoribacter lunatus]
MLKIGLTGGIGSGKTTVAGAFHAKGFPIYIADTEASRLMNTSPEIRSSLLRLLGNDIYLPDNTLNKVRVATLIFNHPPLLRQVNALVHPAVLRDFEEWCQKQHSPLVFFESAILFEAHLESHFDFVIHVTANLPTRIERVMKRDGVSEGKVLERIRNQASEEEKNEKADFILDTTDGDDWKKQITDIQEMLISKALKPQREAN